jgi:hypothetical protein
MKRKPIKIDWERLEEAFTNHDPEVVSYLDVVTGHVVLEGEGEVDEFDGDDSHYDVSRVSSGSARNDVTRVLVCPPDENDKIAWLERFLEEGSGIAPDVSLQLEQALDAGSTAAELNAVLSRHPEAREHWYAYQARRLHDFIERWLDAQGVQPLEAPPWRD